MGVLSIVIPVELHRRIKLAALKKNLSVKAWVVAVIEAALVSEES